MSVSSATGLPSLPDGYFWRIYPGLMGDYLELRSRVWKFSKRVDRRLLPFYYRDTREPIPPEESVMFGAEAIMKEAPFNDPWPKLYGDYPPKKLGE